MLGKITASDRAVVQKVTQALINHGLRPPCDIQVLSKGGNVTLSGTIQYVFQRKNAVRTAMGVPGVRRVIDQLKVKHRETWVDRTSDRRPQSS
jgi:osmotically-inducible protein OsmY